MMLSRRIGNRGWRLFGQSLRGLSSSSGGGEGGDSDAKARQLLEDLKSQLEKKGKGTKPLLAIGFTCSFKGPCQQTSPEARRVAKLVSKKSYEEGVVLIHCPCKKLHLIADNLGWFDEEKTNIEQIMKAKGEEVTRMKAEDLVDIE